MYSDNNSHCSVILLFFYNQRNEIVKKIEEGKCYSLLTAFLGNPDIPRASEWNGKFAVIIPGGVKESIKEILNIDTEGMDDVSLIMIHQKLDMFNRQDIRMIKNFMTLNEAKVLGGIDVSTVKTFQDIHNYTSLASLKSITNEFRKQVKIDYEDVFGNKQEDSGRTL